jgi:PAS domain-containing protein
MFTHTREELTKGPIGFLISDNSMYPKKEFIRWLHKAFSEGPQTFEWLAKDSENKQLWVEVNLKRCVIGGDDRILIAIQNIIKRKQTEKALHKSETLLRRVFEGTPFGLCIMKNLIFQQG